MEHRTGTFRLPGAMLLESGERLENVELAYESLGALSGGVVLLLHGTARSHRAFSRPAAAALWSPDGWAAELIGPGRLLDPSQVGILSVNLLGSPFGSTSAATVRDGRPWSERFPELSLADLAQPLPALLDHLGIGALRAAIGFSLGGMVALDLAAKEPERVPSVATILGPATLSDSIRRKLAMAPKMLTSDPEFGSPEPLKVRGALKRLRLTHLRDLYTRDWLSHRFEDLFAAERALEQEAIAFARSFDPWCYLTLCRVMAGADLTPELKGVRGRALVVSCASDEFAFPSRMQDTYHALSAAGVKARYYELQSEAGHAAPYLEPKKLLPALAELLS